MNEVDMPAKVLFVDDELNILAAHRRGLRSLFDIDTRASGRAALEAMRSEGPFAVVVSDLRMPVMKGSEFLARAKAEFPETARIMLTGQADFATALEIVNQGLVFRFLLKPCSRDDLVGAIEQGIRQYELVHAERELLRETFNGAVRILTEILSMVSPAAYGRASRMARMVRALAPHLGDEAWRIEVAAMLSQLGLLLVPAEVLERGLRGEELTGEQAHIWAHHTRLATALLEKLPRIDDIRDCVACHTLDFDPVVATGRPTRDAIPLGARLLRILVDYDTLLQAAEDPEAALLELGRRQHAYDPELLELFQNKVLEQTQSYEFHQLLTRDLRGGMVLREPLRTLSGIVIAGKGQEITGLVLERLHNFAEYHAIAEPVGVSTGRSSA
jgi:response regulator RpfG family c-di-GMP phosphodiesterase